MRKCLMQRELDRVNRAEALRYSEAQFRQPAQPPGDPSAEAFLGPEPVQNRRPMDGLSPVGHRLPRPRAQKAARPGRTVRRPPHHDRPPTLRCRSNRRAAEAGPHPYANSFAHRFCGRAVFAVGRPNTTAQLRGRLRANCGEKPGGGGSEEKRNTPYRFVSLPGSPRIQSNAKKAGIRLDSPPSARFFAFAKLRCSANRAANPPPCGGPSPRPSPKRGREFQISTSGPSGVSVL